MLHLLFQHCTTPDAVHIFKLLLDRGALLNQNNAASIVPLEILMSHVVNKSSSKFIKKKKYLEAVKGKINFITHMVLKAPLIVTSNRNIADINRTWSKSAQKDFGRPVSVLELGCSLHAL